MATQKTSHKHASQHPDHSAEIPRLKRIIGQLEGVKRMIEDKRYCPDILQQLRAANSAIKVLEIEILKGHLACCIRDSAQLGNNSEFDSKLTEILDLIKT